MFKLRTLTKIQAVHWLTRAIILCSVMRHSDALTILISARKNGSEERKGEVNV
jgi:hypothetical protein